MQARANSSGTARPTNSYSFIAFRLAPSGCRQRAVDLLQALKYWWLPAAVMTGCGRNLAGPAQVNYKFCNDGVEQMYLSVRQDRERQISPSHRLFRFPLELRCRVLVLQSRKMEKSRATCSRNILLLERLVVWGESSFTSWAGVRTGLHDSGGKTLRPCR